ncbi:VQ motif-containing protein 25-like [Salvia miltiorrhiza]|uniref:VQ motif-containing protein 25-like n=1 Tax=Salvia miltiorrhiza TaxID=226208 RepID=UPI0025ABB74F|nr:VQ motif-containing protein 25-like [Salvia miltiorrhiza]
MTMENQIYCPKTASSNLSMHRNSQTISKTKPKIRIIHIFAPEIIKTDAANFRELVQRLTGKPDPNLDDGNERLVLRKKEARILSSSKKMGFRERLMKEEGEEIWMSANSGGGFLGGFGEIDHGFLHELNHFQFLEATTAQMQDVYGDHQCQLA